MAKNFTLLSWDYVTFVVFMVFSILAPLWSQLFGRKPLDTKARYIFATGEVSLTTMVLSIARGTLGIRSVLGYPSELFYCGSGLWETMYGMVNAYPMVCYIFIPVYFNLGITSIYQYLDLRFKSRLVRCLASGIYVFRQVCALGIAVYTASLALSTVIEIHYWVLIVTMSLICIIFSIMGGLKAAILSEAIQTLTIASVTLAVIIKGAFISGGPKNVYKINRDGDRLKFFHFTGNLTVRADTLSAWLGQLFMSLSQFGCQQNFMQRYVCLKSMNDVTKAMMVNIPLGIVFFSLAWFAGMVIYSSYYTCDPLAWGYIRKMDEILPFFVEDKFGYIPGFVGIFMATLFNGALSLNVANVNSLATVLWEDFLTELSQFKNYTDKQQLVIIKIISVFVGFIVMATAFGVDLLSGVTESAMVASSATSGPLLGVFVLAALVPVANSKGAAAGMFSSSIIVLWITIGGLGIDKSKDMLPTSTEGCTNLTFSRRLPESKPLHRDASSEFSTAAPPITEKNFLKSMYSISFMYYGFLGTILTVGIGVLVSYLTYNDNEEKYNNKLLHPLIFKWSEYFSGSKPYYIEEPIPANTTTATTNATIAS